MKIQFFVAFCFLLSCMVIQNGCQQETFVQGEILYKNFCENCHMTDGKGLKGVIPPLANADFVKNHQDQLPCIIRKGMQGKVVVNGKTYDSVMNGEPKLSMFEIANIINYINQAWGNDYGYMKFDEVKRELKKCTEAYDKD